MEWVRYPVGPHNLSVMRRGSFISFHSFFTFIYLNPRGGICENFDRDARVIFLGLKFMKMSFFWVWLIWRHFLGVDKLAVIFLGPLKIWVIFWVTELCIYKVMVSKIQYQFYYLMQNCKVQSSQFN